MNTALYIYTENNLSLPEALRQCQAVLGLPNVQTYALLYAPQYCCFAHLDTAGTLRNEHGQALATEVIFEARLFNATAELRWLHVSAGRGRAALLSEDDTLTLFGGQSHQEKIVGRIVQRYLLWGAGTGTPYPTGWSQLAAARTGAFSVPVEQVEKNRRVQLTAVEYLKEYQYGNVGICEERLTGFVVAEKEWTNG